MAPEGQQGRSADPQEIAPAKVGRRAVLFAAADLEVEVQIAYYAEHASERIAEEFYRAFQRTVRRLLENPRLGRVRVSKHPALDGVRGWRIPGFPLQVLYREIGSSLEILHVLHCARDRLGEAGEA